MYEEYEKFCDNPAAAQSAANEIVDAIKNNPCNACGKCPGRYSCPLRQELEKRFKCLIEVADDLDYNGG